jgi:hypothetical protein
VNPQIQLRSLNRASSILACLIAVLESGREIEVLDAIRKARRLIEVTAEALEHLALREMAQLGRRRSRFSQRSTSERSHPTLWP